MGYYSNVSGELKPDETLSGTTLKRVEEVYLENEYGLYEVSDFLTEESGYGINKSPAGTVDFSQHEAFKLYDGADIVTSFIQQVKEETGATYSGVLHIEGEENDDIWRIIVEKSEVFTLRPRIVWDYSDKEQVL